jgi:hypothetical protein
VIYVCINQRSIGEWGEWSFMWDLPYTYHMLLHQWNPRFDFEVV